MKKPLSARHAKRRHQNALRKRRARRLIGNWSSNPEKFADHMAMCSCPACGNPRRHFGDITLSEMRVIDDQKDQEIDLAA